MTSLADAIALMHEVHALVVTERALGFWTETLWPHDGPDLREVIHSWCLHTKSPSLGEILEDLKALRSKKRQAQEQEAERRRWVQESNMSPEERAEFQKRADEFFSEMRARLGY